MLRIAKDGILYNVVVNCAAAPQLFVLVDASANKDLVLIVAWWEFEG
jgi:hypothetical protein